MALWLSLVGAVVISCLVSVTRALTAPTSGQHNSVYLISLQFPTDERFSKHVKDVWRWKDAVLGDGRDFFVPRPKTLHALQQNILQHAPGIQECVILSNCARFELLLLADTTMSAGSHPLESLSRLLLRQVEEYHNRRFQPPFDWPGSIVSYDDDHIENSMFLASAVDELISFWMILAGPTDVMRHLCLVASGMALRPSRPGRATEFRPFSSRDAHVLLQLKRTVAIADGPMTRNLLQGALRAGKAVRNPEATPVILPLRSGTASTQICQSIAATVQSTTIDPIVEETVRALEVPTDDIVTLRTAAMELSRSKEEGALVRSLLHQPTIELRNGRAVNQTFVLEQIANEIEACRLAL